MSAKAIPCVLVKREESRDFDVFFWECFWVFFGVWEREKTYRVDGQKASFRKICVPLSKACPGEKIKVAAILRLPASILL